MSDIQIYQSGGDNGLYPIQNALKSQMIAQVNPVDLLNHVTPLIAKCFAITGFKTQGIDVNLMCNEFSKKLQSAKINLRIGEIAIALDNGVYKKYGSYMGISAAVLFDFIKGYIADADRVEALRIKNLPPPTHRTPNDVELFVMSWKNALNAYAEHHKNGSVGRFGVIVYDFLFKIGLIEPDQDQKNDVWKHAKFEYQGQLRSKKTSPLSLAESKQVERDLQQLLKGEKQDAIIAISKRMIVDEYFNIINLEEQNIYKLIEEKKPKHAT